MPRRPNPDAPTSAERKRRQRERGWQTIELPPDALDAIAAIRLRDGDLSNVATVARVLREAAA